MTQGKRQFVWVMRIFAFMYFVTAVLFFFMPDEVFYMINIGPKVFKTFEEIPMASEHFWLALATSMMVMLIVTAIFSSLYPEVKGYVVIHLASKLTSVAGFLYFFIKHHHYSAYLTGAVTDAVIFVLVAGFYLRSLVQAPAATA